MPEHGAPQRELDTGDQQPPTIELGVAIVGDGAFTWLTDAPEWFSDALDVFARELQRYISEGREPTVTEFPCMLPSPGVERRRHRVPGAPEMGFLPLWPAETW